MISKCFVEILCLLLRDHMAILCFVGVLCLLMFQFGAFLFCVCCCGNLVFFGDFVFVAVAILCFVGILCLLMFEFDVFLVFCVCCCGNFVFCWESKHCIDSHPTSHQLANCAYTDSQTRNQILDTCDDT